MAAVAGVFEKALREGAERVYLEGLLAELRAELVPLLERLRVALGPAPTPVESTGEGEVARLPLVVAELAKYLGQFDAIAPECLERNRAVLALVFSGDEFEKFTAEVQCYAFGEAAERLETAAKAKGIQIV